MAQVLTLANLLQNIQIPSGISPEIINLPPPPKLEGTLAPNNWLSKVRTHATGRVVGSESMVVYKGYVYTGLANGWVVEVNPMGYTRKIARLSLNSCGQRQAKEGDCGRPMGIRLDNNGYLVVADAYHGIIRVNPRTGELKHLVNSQTLQVNGRPLGYINDLTVAKDDTIVFSSSSSKWTLAKETNILYEAEHTGRVLVYDPKETIPDQQVKELITNLTFPNGLQLSEDDSYLLVGESTQSRILRAWIGPNHPKRGTIEVFADNLPGAVDNIRLSPRGTFWVGMFQSRHSTQPNVLDKFGNEPRLRAFLIMLVNNRVKFDNPKFGIVVELDDQGRILRSLQDPLGWRYTSVSEVAEESGILFFASPTQKFLGYTKLSWLPTDSNETSILDHPEVIKFLQQVRKNMLRMTNDRVKEAVVELIREILWAKYRASIFKAQIDYLQQTVLRLQDIIRRAGLDGGGSGGETTTPGGGATTPYGGGFTTAGYTTPGGYFTTTGSGQPGWWTTTTPAWWTPGPVTTTTAAPQFTTATAAPVMTTTAAALTTTTEAATTTAAAVATTTNPDAIPFER